MKKSFAILAAAACALSVTAFAACGEDDNSDDVDAIAEEVWEAVAATDSDVVTADEWAAAFDEANFLNVTVVGAYTCTDYEYTEYEIETYDTEVRVIKSKAAFTEDSSGCITGNGYLYNYLYENDAFGDCVAGSDNETFETTQVIEESSERYEVFEESSYSYVDKYNYNFKDYGEDEDDYEEEYWYGEYEPSAGTVSDSYAYFTPSESYLVEYDFDQFEYADGAYVCTYSESYDYSTLTSTYSETYYVKINDGYISSLVIECNYSSTGITYVGSSEEKYAFIFTDYGTTTVTVPEEFTFEYYYENHYGYDE